MIIEKKDENYYLIKDENIETLLTKEIVIHKIKILEKEIKRLKNIFQKML
ncbi:MAG TPA: hypothetical protein PKN54_10460 [Candidatus Cloacimonas acidaminovorans]|nr:hypothetical protein [Candidatus Cloacimonas acidaminovorans]